MKTVASRLQAAIGDGTIVTCVKVTSQVTGEVVGFTSHDRVLNIEGVDYVPTPGLQRIVMNLRNNTEVSNQEFAAAWVLDLPESELNSGVWDNAEVEVFKADWSFDDSFLQAFSFSGTEYLTSSSVTGITDGKQFTFSCWAYIGTSGSYRLFTIGTSSSPGLVVNINGGYLGTLGWNSSGSVVLNFDSQSTAVNIGQWNHFLISVDLSTTTAHMFVNGTSVTTTPGTTTNDNIDFTKSDYNFGRVAGSATAFLVADVAEVWFDTSYFDLTTASNVELFNAGCIPADMGSDGSVPTGSSPLVYFSGPNGFKSGINSGSGGDFTTAGTITDSTNEPVQLCSPTVSYQTIPVFAGRIGLIQWTEDGFRADIHSNLRDLGRIIGVEVTAKCRHELFSTADSTHIGYCGLSSGSYTYTGSVSSVTTQRITFTGTATGQASGYCQNGVITFTSGANNGISREVKTHTAGGTDTFEVFVPFPFDIATSDTFSVVAGCDKTFATCKSKFSNSARFGGFPHIKSEINFK